MKYIKRIELEGFQSHVNTILEFDSKLNVIVGESDSGKTSVLRAIRWVAFGIGKNENIINKNMKSCRVKIIMSNDEYVEKIITKSTCKFYLSGYSEPHKKKDTPEEVKDILGIEIKEYTNNINNLNFAYQLDPPFLISERGTEGTKLLGKISGAEKFERAMLNTASEKQSVKLSIGRHNTVIESKEIELEQYQDIIEKRNKYNEAIGIKESIVKAYELKEKLFTSKTKLKEIKDKTKEAQTILDESNKVISIEENFKELFSKNELYSKLQSIKPKYSKLRSDYLYNETIINNSGEFIKNELKVTNLSLINDKFNKLSDLKDNLSNKTTEIERSTLIASKRKNIDEIISNISKVKSNIDTKIKLVKNNEHLNDVKVKLESSHNKISETSKLVKYDMNSFNEKVDKVSKLSTIINKMKGYQIEIDSSNILKESYEEKLIEKKKELHDLYHEIEMCPLCGNKLEVR